VAIPLVVGHLILDGVDRLLIERRVGKPRGHRLAEAVPLVRRDNAVVEKAVSSLRENPLSPAGFIATLGRDPEQEASDRLLVEDRGI